MKRSRCSSGGALQEVEGDGGHPRHKSRRGRRNVTPKKMEGRVARGEGCRALVVLVLLWELYVSMFKYVLPVFAVVFVVVPVSSCF